MAKSRVLVIGAGIGGLAAAIELAARGLEVTLLERQDAPGGKLRQSMIGEARLDTGPTVFTMRWVFEEIFAAAGASLEQHLCLRQADVLARHAWSERERLDLYSDIGRSAEAIAEFAGPAEAAGYREFCRRAASVYATLEQSFIRAPRPSPLDLVRRAGLTGLGGLLQISPFTSLWQALGDHFRDPRLRQLFARYATYSGSSPFLAPATLMLIAHVEREGVWFVEGGMQRLAAALADVATSCGAKLRYGSEVAKIWVAEGRAAGAVLTTGERVEADAVIVNGDVAAVAGGQFGAAVMGAVPAIPRARRSLSAVTWVMTAAAQGFPMLRHNVFFSSDYAAEFDDIFKRGRLPSAPTVYVCAQDRDDREGPSDGSPERLLCLVNAPANGDHRSFEPREIEQCEAETFGLLARCGLELSRRPEATLLRTPRDFAQLYPATGGALYGQAVHGWNASFRRPGARTKMAGLYLAGGSAHPGAGLPMAATSGRLAAASLLEDLASTSRSHRMAMPGGMSTR